MKCNGKCHLKKQFQQEDKKESNTKSNAKEPNEAQWCNDIKIEHFKCLSFFYSEPNWIYLQFKNKLFSTSIFHPPDFIN